MSNAASTVKKLTVGDVLDLTPELTRIFTFAKLGKPEEIDFGFLFSQCGKDIIEVLAVAGETTVEDLRSKTDFGEIATLFSGLINENYNFFLEVAVYMKMLNDWTTPKPSSTEP